VAIAVATAAIRESLVSASVLGELNPCPDANASLASASADRYTA